MKKNKTDKSVIKLWNNFIQNRTEFENFFMPKSWYFCDNERDANECAELVVKHIKQATSTSMWWYETYNYPIPEIGDLNIITDWNGKAKAIIRTILVEKIPFKEITEEYAKIEGEGDKSLHYWKKVHWDYYTREMKSQNASPTKNMIIVCERFKTIWPEKA